MSDKNDAVIEILNLAVQYSNGTALAVGAIAAGINAIADAIGASRVTLSDVIDALETQTDTTAETIAHNRELLKAMPA